MRRAKLVGLRIECPRQLPIRHIARKDFAIGPISGPKRYYVVRCDCGDIHHIPMKFTVKPVKRNGAKR